MSNVPGIPYPQEACLVRLLAPNPSPYTLDGTWVHLVGERELAVIDPGPDLPGHADAMLAAIAGRPVTAILVTHTHRDHSPAARALRQATGAPVIGCAPLDIAGLSGAEASFDPDYAPDRVLADGEGIVVDGRTLTAIHTPGHTSNHLCFADDERGIVFTGDHVMGWSTSVVVPPDGSMGAYIRSLEKLRERAGDRIYYPAHGPAISEPQRLVRGMITHRLQRERQIMHRLTEGDRTVDAVVAAAYPALDPRLVRAAAASVWAHLVDLQERGLVHHRNEQWHPTA